jgi:trk system potassium uptake protein
MTICSHSATAGSEFNARVEYLREMRTVIVGCGRVGSNLARWLGTEGDQVTVVDFDERAFNRLGEDFPGDMIFGTAVDEDVLRKAGTEQADAFVAVTNSDNTNIMAGQLARYVFNVPKVICRLYDPGRQAIYKELGLETICSTTLSAEQVRHFFEDQG